MKCSYLLLSALSLGLFSCSKDNVLSKSEKKAGWNLLFDGKTKQGWRSAYGTEFPKNGWAVRDGEIKGELSEGGESGDAGDIVTLKKYKSFELVFDWKLKKMGNSGVKYFVEERQPKPQGSQPAYEYQLIDDANYIYNGKPLPQNLKTAAIYDVLPAQQPDVKMDVWHASKIVVKDNHIEHWLDGKLVMETDRKSEKFLKGVESGKFKNYPGFATIPSGHILLQDHGHNVAFKNIKLKEL